MLLKQLIQKIKDLDLPLDKIIADKINSLSINKMEEVFYKNAGKGIARFKIACSVIGLVMGGIAILLLSFIKN